MLVVRERTISLVIDPAFDRQNASFTTVIDDGFVLGAEVHTNWRQDTDPTSFLRVGIDDDSGIAVSRMSHIDHWKRREGAGFNESYKPLLFQAKGKTLTFKVFSIKPVSAPVYVEIILFYKIETAKVC